MHVVLNFYLELDFFSRPTCFFSFSFRNLYECNSTFFVILIQQNKMSWKKKKTSYLPSLGVMHYNNVFLLLWLCICALYDAATWTFRLIDMWLHDAHCRHSYELDLVFDWLWGTWFIFLALICLRYLLKWVFIYVIYTCCLTI